MEKRAFHSRNDESLPELALDKTISHMETAAAGETHPAAQPDHPRYNVLSEFARGGIGRVLTAHDERLDRPVALKELLSQSAAHRERFEREAAITARLEHPAIVPVHDAGLWSNGAPYYVMKLIRGGRTLKDAVAEARNIDGRLALLPNVIAVADAVAYAHSVGIIHRDLKPSNVLVGPFGETVVIDWGLAKDLASSSREASDGLPYREQSVGVTVAGTVIGTPQYMAPEQARGEAVDRRADVYALGALLFYVLVGKAPFESESVPCLLELVATQTPPALASLEPAIPSDLSAIVQKAMEREPSQRYPSAAELTKDLRRFQTGQLVSARSYSNWALLKRWLHTHRLVVTLSALFCGLLLVVGSVGLAQVLHERNTARRERADAIGSRNHLLLLQARAALERDPTEALVWLKQYPIDGQDWQSAQEIAADAKSRGVARHIMPSGLVDGLEFTTSGRYVAVGGTDRELRAFDVATGKQARSHHTNASITLLAHAAKTDAVLVALGNGELLLWDFARDTIESLMGAGARLSNIAISDDGQLIAGSFEANVQIWNRKTQYHETFPAVGTQRQRPLIVTAGRLVAWGDTDGSISVWSPAWTSLLRYRAHKRSVTSLAASPDGNTFWSAGDDGDVWQWEPHRAAPRRLRSFGVALTQLAASHDGNSLAVAGGDRSIRIWPTKDGAVTVLTGHTDDVHALCFSPNDRMLASGGRDQTIRVYSISTGQTIVLRGHRAQVHRLAFSPDGTWLASGGLDSSIRLWPVDASSPRIFRGHTDSVNHVLFSPDGHLMASDSTDNTVRLWDLERARELTLIGHTGNVNTSAFAPDGAHLVSASRDGSVRLWDTTSGSGRVLVRRTAGARRAIFSPGGRFVAMGFLDGAIVVKQIGAGESERMLLGHAGDVVSLAFSPSGRYLASSGEDTTVRVWDLDSGAVKIWRGHTKSAHGLKFTRDGSKLLSCSADATVRIWDMRDGSSVVLVGHKALVSDADLSLNEDVVLSGGWDGTVRLWSLTGATKQILPVGTRVRYAVFSGDSRLIAAAVDDNTVRIWDRQTGGFAILRGHHGAVRLVAFSPSEPLIASSGDDRTIQLWSLPEIEYVPEEPRQLYRWLDAHTSADSSLLGGGGIEGTLQ